MSYLFDVSEIQFISVLCNEFECLYCLFSEVICFSVEGTTSNGVMNCVWKKQ